MLPPQFSTRSHLRPTYLPLPPQEKTPSQSSGSRTGRKPGSVSAVISLGPRSPVASSGPSRRFWRAGQALPAYWALHRVGFAVPQPVARPGGGLLPHRFTLARTGPWARPLAVFSLWHFPSGYPAQPLAGTLPYGARTFLTQGGWPLSATAPPSWGIPHCTGLGAVWVSGPQPGDGELLGQRLLGVRLAPLAQEGRIRLATRGHACYGGGVRVPWYAPLVLLFLALVGLGVLGLLWLLGALALAGGALWWAWVWLRRRLLGPPWRRLPPP